MDKIQVSFSELSQISGIPQRSLYNLQKQGVLPKSVAKGKHDLCEILPKLVEHLRSESGSGDELKKHRILELRQKSRKLELQNQETEGTLVKAADVVATWSSAFNVCKNRFMGLAVTLADDLAGVTDKTIAKEIIQDAIEEILEELGSGGILKQSEPFESLEV
jgi:hypothetical protein